MSKKLVLWFRVFRAQTAPATVYTIAIPYLLAGGDPVYLLALVPLGILLHLFTFGHNSVMDYWYDIKDPNKQHHPIVRGDISLSKAHAVIHNGLAIVTILFIAVTLILSPIPDLALAMLTLYLIFGHAYNDGLDKNVIHSWGSISMCFTFLALYGWFLGTKVYDIRTNLIMLWAFLTIFYQIAWEGNLKDLWNPAESLNMLKSMGFKVKDLGDGEYRIVGPTMTINAMSNFMFLIRGVVNTIIVLLLAWFYVNDPIIYSAYVIAYMVVSAFYVKMLMKLHNMIRIKFRRQDMLEMFGKLEATEFWRFMTILLLTPLWWLYPILFAYGLLWFVGMNKMLWASRFGPRV